MLTAAKTTKILRAYCHQYSELFEFVTNIAIAKTYAANMRIIDTDH